MRADFRGLHGAIILFLLDFQPGFANFAASGTATRRQ